MSTWRPLVNDLVRIGKGKRVYRIRHVFPSDGGIKLAADAKHLDAARRVPDEFRVYRPNELTPVIDNEDTEP